jgi:2,4-dichlorophenol 6-monooxygenase
VAKFYRSRKIRNAFIAGDAAHCFPSTGGLGINTGIGDVHNLVWKIQAVENKWAPESLLDTYETERIPIAIANSTQSSRNETKIHRLGRAVFGEDDKSVEQRMAEATARQEIQDAIMDNYEHFDSLDLQLGYVYGRPRDWSKSVSGFVPTSVPGARLPHAWVMFEGREITTLDTAKGNGFTLYTSPDFVAIQKLEIDRVPIEVVQIGRTITDEDGEWTRLMDLQEGPAGVLVRPDQHILAKVRSIEEIVSILRAFLATS